MEPVERKPGEIRCTITIEGDHGSHAVQGIVATNKMLEEVFAPAEWLAQMTHRYALSVCNNFLPKWAATTSKRHK